MPDAQKETKSYFLFTTITNLLELFNQFRFVKDFLTGRMALWRSRSTKEAAITVKQLKL